jgi:hypothetical protein
MICQLLTNKRFLHDASISTCRRKQTFLFFLEGCEMNKKSSNTKSSRNHKSLCGTANQLHGAISREMPDLAMIMALVYVMIKTSAFQKIGFKGAHHFANEVLNDYACNRPYFNACIKAAEVAISINVAPTLSNFDSLLALSHVATCDRKELLALAIKEGWTKERPNARLIRKYSDHYII